MLITTSRCRYAGLAAACVMMVGVTTARVRGIQAVTKPQSASSGSAGARRSSSTRELSSKEKWVQIDAEDWKDDAATGIGSGHHVRWVEDDRTITGDTLQYNRKKKLVDAEGHLVLDDSEYHVTGTKATVDNGEKKLAVVTGDVVVVIKPKPPKAPPAGTASATRTAKNGPQPPPSDGEEDTASTRRRGGTVTCDRIDDYYRKKLVLMHGHLVFKQRFTDSDGKEVERTATAEHAEYDGDHELLTLFAPVDVHDSQGQEYHFDGNVTVGTREGAETIASTGKAHAKMLVKEEEEENQEPNKPAAKPAQQPVPPPPAEQSPK